MRLLLDTHFAFWAPAQRELLRDHERERLAAATDLVISSVSLWELRLKWQRLHLSGARKGPVNPADLMEIVLAGPFRLLPLTPVHAVTPLAVPLPHSDPFDELLLAQAQVENLRLMTRDNQLRGHPLALTV